MGKEIFLKVIFMESSQAELHCSWLMFRALRSRLVAHNKEFCVLAEGGWQKEGILTPHFSALRLLAHQKDAPRKQKSPSCFFKRAASQRPISYGKINSGHI